MLSGNAAGYALFKKSTPYFLQVASTFSHLWAPNSAIYISHALHCQQYEIRAFALVDSVTALAFGIPPLLHYETTIKEVEHDEGSRLIEWVHGVPEDILVLLARINAWRASRWIESPVVEAEGSVGSPGGVVEGLGLDEEEWRVVERLLNGWTPTIEQIDGSFNSITRLAIQESWRQAAFIYLYMVCSPRLHPCGVY